MIDRRSGPLSRPGAFHIHLPALGAIAAAALLLGACRDRAAAADPGTPAGVGEEGSDGSTGLALPVVGEPVTRGDLVLTVATTGQVRADRIARLRAETGGTIIRLLVTAGTAVHQGDTLLQLDPRPFDLAVREAEAALAEAEIRLSGNISSDSILLGPGQDTIRARNAVVLSGVPAAEVRLERAKLDRERVAVTAPFDGVIDRIDVSPGERLSVGQDIATVVDMTHLRVTAQVLEHDLPFVRVGGVALITTPAQGGAPIRGRILSILPLVDTVARAGRVDVALPAGAASLRPGMYTDVRLEATRLPNRILVPARAVIERDGRPLVFVAKGGRAQWVYIFPGRSNGLDTEVLPDSSTGQIPVGVGDTVLVEGHLTLTHDAPIRVTAAAERAP
ncbi:MAG: efflux RND transporter periplasmic adaptor subunit [Gemmatimonadales bacterium]